ncbi:MAG: porin [Novosphingobium sp.]|nr:porin [Novosphingobium sp.]
MRALLPCAALIAASASPATAQTLPGPGHFALALSGFQTAALAAATDGPSAGEARALSETELEASPLVRTSGGTLLGARGVINLTAATGRQTATWRAAIPEWSLFASGRFGRFEVGERAGFPQSLVGFTPSEIALVSAPFGPTGGTRLDPDGRLPTRALPAPLGARINALSLLGYAARFYADRSAKAIWVSPRSRRGFYGAVSFAPTVRQRPGALLGQGGQAALPAPAAPRRKDLVQAAAVWNHRGADLDLTIAATWSHLRELGVDGRWRGLGSVSGGVSATLHDTWAFGLSATLDTRGTRGGARPFGVVASLDRVSGPWTVGGYVQHARAARRDGLPGDDTLDVIEGGASLQVDRNHDLLGAGRYTEARVFAAAYHFRLAANAPRPEPTAQGLVLLAGAQFSFF